MSGEENADGAVDGKHFERELARCLTGDAQAVARVCTDIVSWTGHQVAERPSWANPEKRISLQDFLKEPPRGIKLYYTPALEQALDVVQIYLALVISYMNRIPNVNQAFCRSEAIVPSGRLSLSALVWMLWSRVKFLNNQFNQQRTLKTIEDRPTYQDAFVQTSGSALDECETCSMTQSMISRLVKALETLSNDGKIKITAIPQTRKEMQTEIYLITQWGAVKKWCDAILADLENIGTFVREAKTQNSKLASQLKVTKCESSRAVSLLQNLSREKEGLVETTEKAMKSRASSVMKVNDLNKKLRAKTAECDEWENRFHDLESSTAGIKTEVRELKQVCVKEKEKNMTLVHEIQRRTRAIEEVKKEMEKMQKEFASTTYILKDDIAAKDLTISQLQEQIKRLDKAALDTQQLTEELKKELKEEKRHGAEIWKSYEELKSQKTLLDAKLEHNYAEMDDMFRRLNIVEKNVLALPKSREPH